MLCPRIALILTLLAWGIAHAQQIPTSRQIVEYSQAQAEALIQEAINQEFSPVLVDRLAVLLVNRPAEFVPRLAAYIASQYRIDAAVREERLFTTAASLVAYTGDAAALRAVEELIALDQERFTPLVQSTLNNAQNWRNPYDVAYRAAETGNEVIRGELRKWLQSRVESTVSHRFWAVAMNERYPGGLSEAVFERDPLVSMLETEAKTAMKTRLRDESERVKQLKRQ
ncbi:MAG: hypothetical protein KJZ79_04925 [Bryobacteraceae bacterium]|nr:hypothetical protein [Bryobacteraceae bacterium]